MAFNTFGSAAGGFMTAFLAAQRLRMQREFYESRAKYYDWLMHGGNSDPKNTPAAAAQRAHDAFLQSGAGSGEAHKGGNNPGNLESNAWTQSLPGYTGKNGRFATFDTPENGAAALDRNLQGYGQQGINTPLSIAQKWAPAGDGANDPTAYGGNIAKALGVAPTAKIDMSDPAVRAKISAAIATTENADGSAGKSFVPIGQAAPVAASAPMALHPATQPLALPPVPPTKPADLTSALPVHDAPPSVPANPTPGAATPQSNPQNTPAVPPIVIPKDHAQADPQVEPQAIPVAQNDQSDQSDVYAAAKGGVVQRMAKGGVVKAFDLGGPTDDESEDAQFDNEANSADYEDARAGGNTGNPELAGVAPPQGTPPALIQPPQGAIPTGAQDQQAAAQGPQVASSNPYLMGGLPRIGAGLGGSGMRMGGGGGPTGRGGRGGTGGPSSYYAGMNHDPSQEPDPETPQIADEHGNLASTAAAAIQGGMSYIAKMLGGAQAQNGAVPTGSLDVMHNHSATPEEMQALRKAEDPTGTLRSDMADIAGLEGMHQWYIQHGMPQEADKAAASILMASRDAAAHHGDEAIKMFYKGDPDGAVKAIVKGYDSVIDGNTVQAKKGPGDNYTVTQLNMQNRAVWQKEVAPQEIMQAALGLKDGTMVWKLYSEAAAKYDPQGAAQAAQMTPADQAALGKLSNWRTNGQAPAQGQPPQAVPVNGPAPPVTPGSSGPQAIPVQAQSGAGAGHAPTPPPSAPPAPAPPPMPQAPAQPPAQAVSLDGSPQPGMADIDPRIVNAHQAQLNQEIAGYKAQILDPALAQRPEPDRTYYDALPANDPRRKIYEQKYKDELNDWNQTVYAPAQKMYGEMVSNAQKGYQDSLTGARQALNMGQTEQFRAAAQKDTQQHSDASAEVRAARDREAAATLESNREKAAATLESNREKAAELRAMVDKPVSPDETTDATNAMFKVFNPTMVDPSGAPTTEAKNAFSEVVPAQNATALRGAIVDVARHNQIDPDEAASAVYKMVAGQSPDGKLPFEATPWMDGVGGRTLITFNDDHVAPITVPTARFKQILAVRSDLSSKIQAKVAAKAERDAKSAADEKAITDARSAVNARDFAAERPGNRTLSRPPGLYVPGGVSGISPMNRPATSAIPTW